MVGEVGGASQCLRSASQEAGNSKRIEPAELRLTGINLGGRLHLLVSGQGFK